MSSVKAQESRIYRDDVETASLLDKRGNVILEATSGATNYVQFTEEQLSKMKSASLTHNHPSNSAFSAEDIDLLTYRELNAMRATGKSRTYQLKKITGTFDRSEFAIIYRDAMKRNKAITDARYSKIEHYKKTDYSRYIDECERLNNQLNELNHKWLKTNSKKYGYRYSMIRRK